MNNKLTTIIEQLKTLTLLEAAELVKEIETVFGVDTSVSVASVALPAQAAAAPVEAAEEKSSFDIDLSLFKNSCLNQQLSLSQVLLKYSLLNETPTEIVGEVAIIL